ncbi:MAG: DNA-binding protein, partial [Odoribacter sp.]|nr:DNA-binding protein [Odoribacter sp.]
MMHLLDKYNPEVKELFSDMEKIRKYINTLKPEKRKALNNETYLTNKEVCEKLKISSRTLQQYK